MIRKEEGTSLEREMLVGPHGECLGARITHSVMLIIEGVIIF